jgi:hypothetical protein
MSDFEIILTPGEGERKHGAGRSREALGDRMAEW